MAGIATSRPPSRPLPQPTRRELQVFAFDPSRGKNYGNFMVLEVPYEPLQAGPVGEHMAVIDYDSVNECYYEPVNLDAPLVLATDGLAPSESDPRFHQQMVYAVASDTISRFQFALGRPVSWRKDTTSKQNPMHNKLVFLPHGIQEPNAYYDPDLRGVVFGYFKVSEKDPGDSLPGQTIYTCLSHDVIAHETTHALLDGVRSYFMQPTNQDVAAFHEAFADIVALLQHFSFKKAVLDALRGTRGSLFPQKMQPDIAVGPEGPQVQYQLAQDNPLVGLAAQFGDALGLHAPLRRMIGVPPNSHLLDEMTEPHDRGSILVAAVFDAFFTIFLRRTEDLFRIAGVSRKDARDCDLHPDLLARLADEASKTAGHFETLCIRALDYTPPVDITFGDYLRALITADRDLVTNDSLGYRSALIDAFRSRGIRPETVTSYSEEELAWRPPDQETKIEGLRILCPGMSPEERREIEENNARTLHAFAVKNADVFGFANVDNLFVPSFHHVERVGPDGTLLFEMVAQIIEHPEPNKDAEEVEVYGGATVIFNTDGTVRYAIRKSLKNERPEMQAEFRREMWERTNRGTYLPYENKPINFRAIHGVFGE